MEHKVFRAVKPLQMVDTRYAFLKTHGIYNRGNPNLNYGFQVIMIVNIGLVLTHGPH